MDKLKESNPRPDHDFGLSWIKKDGQGRVFYMALGHNERIYAMTPMLEHMLAGMQYALGDLKADDSPSQKSRRGKTWGARPRASMQAGVYLPATSRSDLSGDVRRAAGATR